jgi:hypothetical protein
MISVTDIDDYEMRAVVRSRYPSLMNGGTRTDRSRTGVESGAGGN